MTLAIIGSRECPPIDIMKYLDEMPTEIVSGGARGADTYAREFALGQGIALKEILPDYSRYRQAAPLLRDRQIVDYSDSILAFWNGQSRGTRYVIEYARRVGKPVRVVMV